MVTILIVEDDAAIRMLTKLHLQEKYHILEAGDGEEALDVMGKNRVDLLIADIMMPHMDGFQFVDSARVLEPNIPILMLTAMTDFSYKKKGYALGIDDYMTKPVNFEELQWHIEALLRRAKIADEKKIVIGDAKTGLVLSEDSMEATLDGKKIAFTEREFQILWLLLSYPGKLFTKQAIMDDIWGYDSETSYDSIKTIISRIRSKLSDCSLVSVSAVRGLGYKAEVLQ